MYEEPHHAQQPNSGERFAHAVDTTERQHVQELTWALLDDALCDAEFVDLERRMLNDASARTEYLRCMQLHAGLAAHFARTEPRADTTQDAPILGSLAVDMTFPGSTEAGQPT